MILNVYPSPTVNQINISFDLVRSTTLKIFASDISGKIVKEFIPLSAFEKGHYEKVFSVADISNGFYLVVLDAITNKIVKKIVISK